MAKRPLAVTDGSPDEKRAKGAVDEFQGLLQGLQPDDVDIGVEAEFFVEQKLVGWIIGTRGSTLKEIEQEYKVKVTLDQSNKKLGYSKVQISGTGQQVTQAADHINLSLARAVQNTEGAGDGNMVGPFLLDAPPFSFGAGSDEGLEEMQVEQRYVGWLLGKGGGVIREIEATSGCKVSMNQETRHMGFSKVQIRGDPSQRSHARQLILDSLDRARTMGSGAHWPRNEEGGQYAAGVEGTDELRIEQRFVGWLLGRGGGVVRETEQSTGCRIAINQETRHLGYSRAMLHGDFSQRSHARQLILESIDRARQAGGNGVSAAVAFGQEPHTPSGPDLTTLQQQVAQAALGCTDRLALLEALARLQAPPDPSVLSLAIGGAHGHGGHGRGQSPPHSAAAAFGDDEIQVEQRWVGWLLGKGGSVLRELEGQSGARISIDQSTKPMGFSTVRFAGDSHAKQVARRLVQEKLAQASTGE